MLTLRPEINHGEQHMGNHLIKKVKIGDNETMYEINNDLLIAKHYHKEQLKTVNFKKINSHKICIHCQQKCSKWFYCIELIN